MIEAEITDTALPLESLVTKGGVGVSGLTVLVALRDASTDDSWLDFSDNTFKTIGWTARQAPMAEVDPINAPGMYRRTLDLSSITGLSVGMTLSAEYQVSGAVTANGLDTILIRAEFYDIKDALDANGYTASRAALLDLLTGVDANSELARKILRNRITMAGFGTGTTTQTVYDDDGTTPLLTWTLTTHGGEDVLTDPGTQTNRSVPV